MAADRIGSGSSERFDIPVLTARTLAKMCESSRFKAFEQSELIERATVRARRQLAALSAANRSAA